MSDKHPVAAGVTQLANDLIEQMGHAISDGDVDNWEQAAFAAQVAVQALGLLAQRIEGLSKQDTDRALAALWRVACDTDLEPHVRPVIARGTRH